MQAAPVTVYVAAALTAATYSLLSRRTAPLVSSLTLITAGAAEWSLAQAVAVGAGSPVVADMGERQVDLTPVLFLITATLWWWAERSGVATRQVPVAYEQVISALSDAVTVLDTAGRVLDVNPAAARILAVMRPGCPVVGRSSHEVVGPEIVAALAGRDQQTVAAPDGAVYDVRVVRMEAADGVSPGTVVVVRWRIQGARAATATFSAGVAALAPGESAEELLRRADRALYTAKERGRDRVVASQAQALRTSM
jgi:GGDEF domain-containing protein